MGMDAHIYRVRNLKQPEQPNFYDNCININAENWLNDEFESPAELWYARKFYGLTQEVFPGYENGTFIEITEDKLKEMIEYATTHLDYFYGFGTVSGLCRALYQYDKAHRNGWIYVYECSW